MVIESVGYMIIDRVGNSYPTYHNRTEQSPIHLSGLSFRRNQQSPYSDQSVPNSYDTCLCLVWQCYHLP